ncbi:hypothetical protein [Aurantiacibacter odishensis]|uniref:hypothetical protein n=1 Tax=Aurantiacibacter odishensis TaxID=1155476 RepID=UPI0013C46283|nr:hypothetical protein [Aurantiacibacter odishensis]
MVELVLIAGVVALVLLWRRVQALEERLRQVEDYAPAAPPLERSAPMAAQAPNVSAPTTQEPEPEPIPEIFEEEKP